MLENTKKLTEVDAKNYDAIFLVGGQGPMYTFKGNKELEKLFVSFYEAENQVQRFVILQHYCLKLKNLMVNYW
jgi:hypothetical protein